MLVGVASHVASNYADRKYQPILEKIEYGSYYIGGTLFGAGVVASTFL